MDFDALWELVQGIQYGFQKDEAAAMLQAVALRPERVVEVGSMVGGSARLLETVAPVLCIDPLEQPWMLENFLKNTTGYRITLRQAKDTQVFPNWPSDDPISFLLIDHGHQAGETAVSLAGWRPHLAAGAIVAVHDYGGQDWIDVRPETDASGLQIFSVVGRLALGKFE